MNSFIPVCYAFGASFIYPVPESQLWNRNVLQSIGISYNSYLTNRPGYTGYDEVLTNFLGSLTINLVPDPVNFIDLRIQGACNIGFPEINTINSYKDYVRTLYFTTFGTLRHMYRKMERPLFQVSAGLG